MLGLAVAPSALLTSRKDRRPSLVLQETKDLLGSLSEDVNRSHELMAELQSLLQASHATSQSAGGSGQDAGQHITAHFIAAEPLLVEDDDEEEMEKHQTDIPSFCFKKIDSVHRLSSAITMDGDLIPPSPKSPSPFTTSAAPFPDTLRPGVTRRRTSCMYGRCSGDFRATALVAALRNTSAGSDSTVFSEVDSSSINCTLVFRSAAGTMPTGAEAAAAARRRSLNIERLGSPASVSSCASGPLYRTTTTGGMSQLPSMGPAANGQCKLARSDTGFVEVALLPVSPGPIRRTVTEGLPAVAGAAASGVLPPVPGATKFHKGLVGRSLPLLRATSNIGRIFGKE